MLAWLGCGPGEAPPDLHGAWTGALAPHDDNPFAAETLELTITDGDEGLLPTGALVGAERTVVWGGEVLRHDTEQLKLSLFAEANASADLDLLWVSADRAEGDYVRTAACPDDPETMCSGTGDAELDRE